MAWLYLVIAGLLEIAWAAGLKLSDGFKKPLPGALTAAGMIASFYFLALAIRTLPLGTAYAIWTGIGAVGTLVVGMIWFDEPFGWLRVLFAALAIAGLAGLKATSGH
jgi:quaternary ammonium compound-resistance protein SugE